MSDDKTKEPIKDTDLDEISGGQGGTRPPIIAYGPPPTNRNNPAPEPKTRPVPI